MTPFHRSTAKAEKGEPTKYFVAAATMIRTIDTTRTTISIIRLGTYDSPSATGEIPRLMFLYLSNSSPFTYQFFDGVQQDSPDNFSQSSNNGDNGSTIVEPFQLSK